MARRKQKLEFVDMPAAKEGDLVSITLFNGVHSEPHNPWGPTYVGSCKMNGDGETIRGRFVSYFETTGRFAKRPGKGMNLVLEGNERRNISSRIYQSAIHSYKVQRA